jgi:D-alanyl-D-alanine carboxypeptidase/D-alanyl-D-alanine-endopeptidase (penicillin-binding protein 4)
MMRPALRATLCLAVLAAANSCVLAQTGSAATPASPTPAPAARTPDVSLTETFADGSSLAGQIAAIVAAPAVARDHWGIQVTTLDGTPIYSLNEAQLFQPASNAKLFTTSAALALLGPDATVTTTVGVNGIFTGKEFVKGNVYLFGDGDANLSGRIIPYAPDTSEELAPLHYLDEFAAEIAQTGLKKIDGDVVGIAHGLYEPYPIGWNIDDLVWGYGAPVSLLSVNDNQLKLTITPATEVSSLASIQITPAIPYYTITDQVLTVDQKSSTGIDVQRDQGSKQLRIYGRIALKAAPEIDHISIDDPAEYAAIALKEFLEQHGVTVTGHGVAEYAESDDTRSFREISRQPIDFAQWANTGSATFPGSYICPDPCDPAKIPRSISISAHTSPTLAQDVVVTNKESLNLHAELLLRRLGARFAFTDPNYSTEDSFAEGARVVRQFLIDAGVNGDDFIFYDGSGLSTHDLVTPRATAKLLSYAAHDLKTGAPQPWFAVWKSSLPVGGEDGTLASRFAKPPLKDHLFAKTGTLGEARALSGYLDAASGRTIIFSIFVGNHLPGTSDDRDAMDKIVAAIQATQ